jgi:hypothetical protein
MNKLIKLNSISIVNYQPKLNKTHIVKNFFRTRHQESNLSEVDFKKSDNIWLNMLKT